ncbi:hypothetical protein [Pseudonocardia sp. NPDC049154]|uniref:hypothetical protein n=1 Tax=Pseudonocardia sp. NPDC049154 TaxID=3155501 RepID=UPI00340D8B2B
MARTTTPHRTGSLPAVPSAPALPAVLPAPAAPSVPSGACRADRLTQRRVIDHGTVHSAACPAR